MTQQTPSIYNVYIQSLVKQLTKYVKTVTVVLCSLQMSESLCTETSAGNGMVYASIPYRNFSLFLNFIPELINIYHISICLFNFSDGISLFCF
jgi:hypothetical protein